MGLSALIMPDIPNKDEEKGLKYDNAEQNDEEQHEKKKKPLIKVLVVLAGLLIGGGIIFYFLNSANSQTTHPESQAEQAQDREVARCGLECEHGECVVGTDEVPKCECHDTYHFDVESKKCLTRSVEVKKAAAVPECETGYKYDTVTSACVLECKHGRAVFDWMGNPTCKCDEGLELDKKKKSCTCKDAQVFDEDTKKCVWKCDNGRAIFDWMGSPICQCNEGFTFDKERMTCDAPCESTEVYDEASKMCVLKCENGRPIYDWMGNPTCKCDKNYKLNGVLCVCGDGFKFDDVTKTCMLECKYGKSIFDWVGRPSCKCDQGFDYDREKQVCWLPCENGKQIFDWAGSPTCRCDERFQLKDKQCIATGPECDPPCGNGRCVQDGAEAICQ